MPSRLSQDTFWGLASKSHMGHWLRPPPNDRMLSTRMRAHDLPRVVRTNVKNVMWSLILFPTMVSPSVCHHCIPESGLIANLTREVTNIYWILNLDLWTKTRGIMLRNRLEKIMDRPWLFYTLTYIMYAAILMALSTALRWWMIKHWLWSRLVLWTVYLVPLVFHGLYGSVIAYIGRNNWI